MSGSQISAAVALRCHAYFTRIIRADLTGVGTSLTAARARVTFLRTDEGGRLTAAMDGYRPHIQLGSLFTSCIVRAHVPGVTFALGSTYNVDLEFVFWEECAARFSRAEGVRLFEGGKLVATGHYLEDPH
jgi:hypothetical protein